MSAHNDIGRPLEGVELRVSSNSSLQFKSAYRALGKYEYIDKEWRFTEFDGWIDTGDTAMQGSYGKYSFY